MISLNFRKKILVISGNSRPFCRPDEIGTAALMMVADVVIFGTEDDDDAFFISCFMKFFFDTSTIMLFISNLGYVSAMNFNMSSCLEFQSSPCFTTWMILYP